jgi:ATP-dependent helicase IRC3
LIFCVRLDHVKNISGQLDRLNIEHDCVYGDINSEDRERLKNNLNSGKIKCIVSSVVWREGISINNLSSCILAQGMKSESAIIQFIGRVLRIADEKNEAIVVDILDPYDNYLCYHTIQRLGIYVQNGWL